MLLFIAWACKYCIRKALWRIIYQIASPLSSSFWWYCVCALRVYDLRLWCSAVINCCVIVFTPSSCISWAIYYTWYSYSRHCFLLGIHAVLNMMLYHNLTRRHLSWVIIPVQYGGPRVIWETRMMSQVRFQRSVFVVNKVERALVPWITVLKFPVVGSVPSHVYILLPPVERLLTNFTTITVN